jgi:excisionase family DNA binding protein
MEANMINTNHQDKSVYLMLSDLDEAVIRQRADRVGKQIGEAAASLLAEIMISIQATRPQEVSPTSQTASHSSKQAPSPRPDGILKASDVAQILRISKGLAYRMMQKGEIPTIQFGRTARVRRQDLDEFIRTHMK